MKPRGPCLGTLPDLSRGFCRAVCLFSDSVRGRGIFILKSNSESSG